MLVGEAPDRRGSPPFGGRSGAFLRRLIGACPRDVFDCSNLLPRWCGKQGKGDAFDAAAASAFARRMNFAASSVVIVAGKRAAAALGLRREYFSTQRLACGATAFVLPHPSGVNRWWNEPANRRRARKFLRRMIFAGRRG